MCAREPAASPAESYKVFQALVEQVRAAGLPVITEFRPEHEAGAVRLNKSGCQGFCQMGPLVTVLPENLLYNKVRVGRRA